MKKSFPWSARVVVLSAAALLSAGNGQRKSPPTTATPADSPRPSAALAETFTPGSFTRTTATDRTFTYLLPKGWTTVGADSETGLILWSPQGGTICNLVFTIPADRGTMQLALLRMRLMGKELSAEHQALFARRVSPRRSPRNIIGEYLPRVTFPLVKDVRILRTWDISEAEERIYQQADQHLIELKKLCEASGLTYKGPRRVSQTIHYQFTFQGNRGSKLQRSLCPPALIGRDATAMEGRMLIHTADLPSLPGFDPKQLLGDLGMEMPAVSSVNQWWMSLTGVEAPAEVFAQHQLLCGVVLRSIRIDRDALENKRALTATPIERFADANREALRKSLSVRVVGSHRLSDALQGYTAYYSTRTERLYWVPRDSRPRPGLRLPTEEEYARAVSLSSR